MQSFVRRGGASAKVWTCSIVVEIGIRKQERDESEAGLVQQTLEFWPRPDKTQNEKQLRLQPKQNRTKQKKGKREAMLFLFGSARFTLPVATAPHFK